MGKVLERKPGRAPQNATHRMVIGFTAAFGICASVAFAGNGKILPPDLAPSIANRIELEIHLGAPAGPDQIALLKQQMRATNRTICDMTDANFRISKVTATQGDATQASGDVWWYPNLGRAQAVGVGQFGSGPGVHVLMYGYQPIASQTHFDGNTLAHELGHHVFGLLDQYAEGPRGVSFDGPDTLPGSLTGVSIGPFFRTIYGGSLFLMQQSGGMLDATRNNTIMQQSMGQVCINSRMGDPDFGKVRSDVNPLYWRDFTCLSNADCGLDQVCQTPDSGISAFDTVQRSSELSVRQNYDLVRGTLGNAAPTEGIEARELVLEGLFATDETPPCAEGNTDAPPRPDLGQQCGRSDNNMLSCDPLVAATNGSRCRRCLLDKNTCAAFDTCGDGKVDADEECDTKGDTNVTVKACADLGLSGGNVRCGAFCVFDTSACSPTLTPPLDTTTLATAAASSTFWTATQAYDHKGVIAHPPSFADNDKLTPLDFDQVGMSAHAVYVFATQQTRTFDVPSDILTPPSGAHEIWSLVFAADGAEFGRASGSFTPLGTYKIELIDAKFADMKGLPRVNVLSGPPSLFLGFTAPQGTETPTGAFTRNPGVTVTLATKLQNLVLVTDFASNVSNGHFPNRIWPRGTLYARNGVSNDNREIPQYPAVGDALRAKISFSDATGRYESSDQTNSLLEGALSTIDLNIPGFPALTPAQVTTNQNLLAMGGPAALSDHFKSDWEVLTTVIPARWPGINVTAPSPLPSARFDTTDADGDGIPDQCPDPVFITPDPVLPGANDQVVVVLDRSGSMATQDAPGAPDLLGLSRLDFAKAGTEAFLQELDTTNEPQFGLVWFSDGPEPKVGSMGALRHLVPGIQADDPMGDKIGVQTVIDNYLQAVQQSAGDAGSEWMDRHGGHAPARPRPCSSPPTAAYE